MKILTINFVYIPKLIDSLKIKKLNKQNGHQLIELVNSSKYSFATQILQNDNEYNCFRRHFFNQWPFENEAIINLVGKMKRGIHQNEEVILIYVFCYDIGFYYNQQLVNINMENIVIETAQEMRKTYLPLKYLEIYKDQQDYFQMLENQGLMLNPKIHPSVFHLKNGLPYIGMTAKQKIQSNEILIRVPENLLLASAKALDQPSLFEVYKDMFFLNDLQTWQNRVIIVYCMYILQQKDEQNPWFQMIKRFPKQCDIACFWTEDELSQFKDLTVKSAAELELKTFQQQWAGFLICQKKYTILQQQQFNKQNYKLIFITLTNRSFGKYIRYATLVPFAELFNHHCSKVNYTVEKDKQQSFTCEIDKDDEQSSIGSYDSNNFLEEGQFDYDGVDVTPFVWETAEDIALDPLQKEQIEKRVEKLQLIIEGQIEWKDFSVLFVGHLDLKLKFIQNQYQLGKKQYERAIQQLEIVQRSLNNFINLAKNYYAQTKKRVYLTFKQEKKKLTIDQFSYPKYSKEFESLIIKTSKFDQFDANNQVYFRYGRDSNRTLLLIYGFAIEGNKYEHVWVSFNLAQCLQDYPDILDRVIKKKLSLFRKFKIHNHLLNMDLIIFFRLNSWMFYHERAVDEIFKVKNIPTEIVILQQIISILTDNLATYQGDYDLTDKSLNYHQYFTAVYHLEKYRILAKQIYLLKKLVNILGLIVQGESKQKVVQNLTKSQKYILRHYLSNIQTD